MTIIQPLGARINDPRIVGALQASAIAVADCRLFGLAFDGTNETAKFQIYLNYCRDNNLSWYLPQSIVADGLVAYTSGACALGAKIIAYNAGQSNPVFVVAPVAADVTTVPSSEYASWGGLIRFSGRVSGLSGRRGQYITIAQQDALIGRFGSGGVPYKQNVGFVVWSDAGDIMPALSDTLTWPGTGTVVTATTIRGRVEVSGLQIELRDPVSGSPVERKQVVAVDRPNTVIQAEVISTGTAGAQQGFVTNNACSVKYRGCLVDNIATGTTATEYGFNSNTSALLVYEDCRTRKTRRAIDGQYTNTVEVRGGSFDGGIGAHWGHNYVVRAQHISIDYTAGTQHAYWFSGGNFTAEGATISLEGASKGLFGLRSDTLECYGTVSLQRHKVIINNTGGAIGATPALYLVNMSGVSAADVYDSLRPITLPSHVILRDNEVEFLGPNTASLQVVSLPRLWTAVAQNVTVEGDILIEGNRFNLAGGTTEPAFSNPRLIISAARPAKQVGGGYRFTISDLPCLYLYGTCDSTVVNSASRHSFDIRRVPGLVKMEQDYGTYSGVTIEDCGGITKTANPTAGLTAVGDEAITEFRRRPNFVFVTYPPAGGNAETQFASSRVDSANGYAQLTGGNGIGVVQAQGPTNCNLTLLARGTGKVDLFAPTKVPGFAFASLPAVATYADCLIRVTDRNNRLAVSDGTSWRFMDGTVAV